VLMNRNVSGGSGRKSERYELDEFVDPLPLRGRRRKRPDDMSGADVLRVAGLIRSLVGPLPAQLIILELTKSAPTGKERRRISVGQKMIESRLICPDPTS
jgi:hypothetical protein